MNEDAILLSRFVETHDEVAFTELVRRHLPSVHATALRRVGGDVHLAQDVAQTVFISLARKAATLRGHRSLAGWLYVSTHHASAELVRREQRRKQRDATAQSMQLADTHDGPPIDPSSLRSLLDDVLVELKREDCDAVVLRFFAQRSFAEIGATFRVSEEAARKRVDRALRQVQSRLSRRGITSSATAISTTLATTGIAAAPATLVSQIATIALAQNLAVPIASLASAFTSWLLPAAATAVAVTGLWTILPQQRANQAMANDLALSGRAPDEAASVRSEMDELTREIEEARARIHAAANTSTSTSARDVAFPVEAPSHSANARTVMITTEGTLQWDGQPVTLDEFLVRLTDYKSTAARTGSELVVQGNGVQFPQLNYVLEEARKAGITRLIVESDSEPDPAVSTTWF